MPRNGLDAEPPIQTHRWVPDVGGTVAAVAADGTTIDQWNLRS